jgi:hypothetical protein
MKDLQINIQHKLDELEKAKDMDDIRLRGKLSVGISSKEYGHLPAWNNLVKKKKFLDAFFLSLMVVTITGDIWDNLIKIGSKHWQV